MAASKQNGTILLVIGIVILFVALFADALKIGQAPQFGNRQLGAAVLGVVFLVVGFLIRRKK